MQRRLSRRSSSQASSVRRSKSSASMLGGVAPSDGHASVAPWEIQPSFHGNVGLHKAVASVSDLITEKKWIGILDLPTDDMAEDMRKDVDEKLNLVDNVPVWIQDEEFTGCYDVFCHQVCVLYLMYMTSRLPCYEQVLWPSLHYAIPDAPKTKVFYESSSFAQYKAVNQKFADTIVAQYKEGDIVFINDYHLCLVPELVRQKLPNAIIGFFLHVAWPSTEIFRCLAGACLCVYHITHTNRIYYQYANRF